jgi:hypothetical protein
VVHDPEEKLVLHVGRRRADLELEHLIPARVPPRICITTTTTRLVRFGKITDNGCSSSIDKVNHR